MISRLALTVVWIAVAALLAGCGVRGALDMPPDPRGEPTATASADSGQGKPEGAAPKPHKGFILDGLIR
jgi:predicted small lipoprotein YifL